MSSFQSPRVPPHFEQQQSGPEKPMRENPYILLDQGLNFSTLMNQLWMNEWIWTNITCIASTNTIRTSNHGYCICWDTFHPSTISLTTFTKSPELFKLKTFSLKNVDNQQFRDHVHNKFIIVACEIWTCFWVKYPLNCQLPCRLISDSLSQELPKCCQQQ